MLVKASAKKEPPTVLAPLVLKIARKNVQALQGIVVVAQRDVVKIVVIIFSAGMKRQRSNR